jgi:hypothetical protein
MINKIIPRQLDSTTDLKLTSENAMVDALNVRYSSNDTASGADGDDSSGDAGVLKNVKGNSRATFYNNFDQLQGVAGTTHRTIGSVVDNKAKIIYFFVWSSDRNEHGIYAYDPYGKLPKNKTVPQGKQNSVRLIIKSSQFNFPEDGFVSADIVHVNRSEFEKYPVIEEHMTKQGYIDDMNTDAIIYFTDNKNEPKKVNAYRALLDNAQQTTGQLGGYFSYSFQELRDLVSSCPRTPLEKIKFEFGYDPQFLESNFKNTSGFQFAYQWIYKDGIESSISPYSLLAVPPVTLEQGAQTYINHTINNVCVLTLPPTNKEVDFIKILVREGDNGSWLVVDEVSTTDSSENWLHTSSNYKFYNNKILVGVSAEEVAKQFDNVPKIAQCQVVSNNRLFYGNYVDSFDNVKVTAKITPKYSPRPTDEDIEITVVSGIRPHAIWNEEDNLQTKVKKNKMYNAGANYIIDARGIPKLSTGDVVSFQLSIAPDRNFHIYKRKHFMPAPTIRTADTYFNGDDSYLLTNSSTQNLEYISTVIPGENFIQGANIWGNSIKDELTYRYVDRIGTVKTVTKSIVGSSEENPLIIQGGQLEFDVSFQYEGQTVINDDASAVVATTLGQMLAGYNEFTYQISVLSQNNSYSHSVNLGLTNFTEITTSRSMLGVDSIGNALTPDSSPDHRSNLICSIGDYSAAFVSGVSPELLEDLDGITINPPIGYFIVNKAKVNFSFDFVKSAEGSNGSVVELLLCVDDLKNIDLVTCVRSANAESPWYVLTKEFLNGDAGTPNSDSLEAFLSEAGFPTPDKFFQISENSFGDEYVDWGSFNNLNNLYGIFNYTKQFGYLENLNEIDLTARNKFDEQTADISIVGICLTDGESSAGGAVGGENYNAGDFSKMGSISKVNRYFLPPQLSSWTNGLSYGTDSNIGSQGGLLYAVGGVFFTGTNLKIALVPRDVFNHIDEFDPFPSIASFNQFGGKEKSTFMPLTFAAPLSGSRYIPEQEYDDDIKYSEIETIYSLFSGDTLKDYNEYRSFKSSSSHEFGVIYYDERGRHGFVNPIGSVYVAGYSSQERPQGEQKGKVDIEININSGTPPPPWARFYQFAHTRSTSVQDFVQYTAGGAFTRVGGTETEQNIYISLNYLQTSIVSYSSSFGARSPEGGLQLYKFKKGDRLRVISYKTTSEQIVYPNKYDFEIVDVVNLGDSNNPLHAGNTTPPFNKMGEFAIIKNNPTASPFDFASVNNETDVWGNNCIIEIYTPSKISEQEQKIYYEIGPIIPVQLNGNQLTHGEPTLLTEGDVWWRKVAVNFKDYDNAQFVDLLVDTLDSGGSNTSKSNFKNYYLESKTFTDLVRADSIGIGRPNSVLKNAKETRNESSITYSDQSAVSTTRPKYSSFNYSLLNYKDIPEVYGSINFMIDRGDSILVIQEDKVSYSPVLRNLLSDNADSEFLVSSTDVLGTSKFYAGKAGCDNNPESVVDVDGTVYFVHKSTAKVFKLTSTGIEDVSSTGMSSYLREMFNSILNTSSLVSKADIKVIGGYDPLNEEYVFTVKKIDVDPTRTNGNRVEVDSVDSPKKGCINPNACNYDPDAKIDDGTCKFPIPGRDCDGKCIDDIDDDDVCDDRDPPIYGCTNPNACNYNPLANADDNSCVYAEYPYDCNNNCTDFHPNTNFGTSSNVPFAIGPVCIDQTLVRGCMDPSYSNYDPNANYPYSDKGAYLCFNVSFPTLSTGGGGQVAVGGGDVGTAGGNGQGGQAAVGGGSVGTAGGNSGVNVIGGGDPFAPTNTVVVNTIEKFIEYNGLKMSDLKELFDFTKTKSAKLHQAFNPYDFDNDGTIDVDDFNTFFAYFETDVNENFIIPPSKPSGQAMTEQINAIVEKLLQLNQLYQKSTEQVAPLVDVNVSDYLLYLAGLSGPPESLVTASGSTIVTDQPEAVTNLLDFLSGYTP